MPSPAEEMAAKKQKAKDGATVIPWGQRIAARRRSPLRSSVKEIRKAMNLTQRDVAEGVGTTGATINDAENGREIHLSLALKIAKFFGKTVEEIWQPLPGGEVR